MSFFGFWDAIKMTTLLRSALDNRPIHMSERQMSKAFYSLYGRPNSAGRPLDSTLQFRLLHRVVDYEGIGALGLLGDDWIRPSRHERCHRPVVILDVQLAVSRAEQLGDFRHHPLLVLLGLRAGGVAGEDDFHGFVWMALGVVPALI